LKKKKQEILTMKITKRELKQIIKEELAKALAEKMERLDEASQEDIDREFDCKTKMREKYPKKEDQANPDLGAA